MPAKKPAPKSAKGKKAASRPAARKTAARKPAERVKAAAHVRKSTASPRKAPPRPTATTSPETNDVAATREMAEPVLASPAAETPGDDTPSGTLTDRQPDASPALAAQASQDSQDSLVQDQDSAAQDSDDSEGVEPGSLLAGPRNVKPYIVKRGEQYMSKEQLEHFRQILLNWKRDLMEEVDRTVSHMKDEAANFPDPNDRATQEEEFSLELRTRDRERKLIRKIDEALKRIDDGTYGYCLETGEEIGIKRLEARPVATLCLEAQERRERRERQYGDRDDRYR